MQLRSCLLAISALSSIATSIFTCASPSQPTNHRTGSSPDGLSTKLQLVHEKEDAHLMVKRNIDKEKKRQADLRRAFERKSASWRRFWERRQRIKQGKATMEDLAQWENHKEYNKMWQRGLRERVRTKLEQGELTPEEIFELDRRRVTKNERQNADHAARKKRIADGTATPEDIERVQKHRESDRISQKNRREAERDRIATYGATPEDMEKAEEQRQRVNERQHRRYHERQARIKAGKATADDIKRQQTQLAKSRERMKRKRAERKARFVSGTETEQDRRQVEEERIKRKAYLEKKKAERKKAKKKKNSASGPNQGISEETEQSDADASVNPPSSDATGSEADQARFQDDDRPDLVSFDFTKSGLSALYQHASDDAWTSQNNPRGTPQLAAAGVPLVTDALGRIWRAAKSVVPSRIQQLPGLF